MKTVRSSSRILALTAAALAVGQSSALSMQSTAIHLAFVVPSPDPVDGSHLTPTDVPGVGKVYKWMLRNSAQPEVNDPVWRNANIEAKRILAKRPNVRAVVRLGGPSNRKLIALTFDDGPHQKWTPLVLDLLDQVRVKATFFVVGKQVRKFPELLKDVHRRGHEVANHTFSHIKMSEASEEIQLTEYLANNEIIRAVTGVTPASARPPGGRRTSVTYEVAALAGLKTSLWTCDPLDYAFPGEKVLMARMLRGLKPGANFLLHSGAPDTMAILPEFVANARRQGYEFVTERELFASPFRREN